MNAQRTIVIGGGIVGLCSAYYLAQRGHPVVLVERSSHRDTASTGNAGIVALGHLPLPRPGLAMKALRWMLDSGAPLYVPPRFDAALFRWMWRFHRSCNPRQVDRCMRMLGMLGHETIRCWQQIIDDERIDCDYLQRGWFDVFRTPAGRRHAEDDADVVRSYGFEAESIDGDQLRADDPAFSDDVLGAVRYTESAFLDPGRFIESLHEILRGRGVALHEETMARRIIVEHGRVVGVEVGPAPEESPAAGNGQARAHPVERIEADSVILAAGSWTTELARGLGLNIPMQAAKGYHLDLVAPQPRLQTACVTTEAFVAVTPMGETLRIAGTLELSGLNHRLVRRRLDMLRIGARQYFNGIDGATVKSEWCGLRPCTPDGMPVVGFTRRLQGLFIATGHAKMGLTHGPITGRLAAECILNDEPSLDISPMSPDRF